MPILQFKGKTAIECYHHTLPHHIFDFDERLSVLETRERPTLDGNLIIEGDNLLALKALLPTHTGRIKCVYIDPPYNTGEEKWVYNDNLTQPQFKEWIGEVVGKEGEDATRHDKWCCMMYPRLQLLKELLADNGLIFVSIDDNEIANLNFLLDEIFGSENRIERIVWKKSYGGGAKESHIVTLHEYILCYAKDKRNLDSLELNPDPLAVERYYKYKDLKFEIRGPYRLKPLEATKSMGERKNLVYPIPMTDGTEVWPKRQWWWKKERTMQALANDELVFTKGKDGISVSYKQYLKDETGEERGAKLFSVIDGIYTQEGTNNLKEVFAGNLVLPFPKPVRLLKKLLELITEGDDIILDSFAGSGTTAQAVLELNNEDEGNRRFILVQQPFDTKENEGEKINTCETITAQRVRKVIQGYQFAGTQIEVLLEKKISLNTLKNAEILLKQIEAIKKERSDFDEISTECKEGFIRVQGIKHITDQKKGLPGSFTYTRLGPPLFGEYRDLGKALPSYEELAKYIFYTETSSDFDYSAMDAKTGRIGEHKGTIYYLLYTPNGQEDRRLDLRWLKSLNQTKNHHTLVVYSEKIWIHRDDLAKFESETKQTVRPMLIPFHLK